VRGQDCSALDNGANIFGASGPSVGSVLTHDGDKGLLRPLWVSATAQVFDRFRASPKSAKSLPERALWRMLWCGIRGQGPLRPF